MSFLSRLFAREPDPREAWRPLWHTLVGTAREEHWYADRGAADTLCVCFCDAPETLHVDEIVNSPPMSLMTNVR